LFATRNSNKLREVKAILPNIEWLSPDDFPALKGIDPEETAATFQENARIKAVEYGDTAGVMTVGEDGGLAVDALGGEPGIRSARWIAGTAEDRNAELLRRLGSETNRRARFVAVVCYYDPKSKQLEYFEGVMPGQISLEPRGQAGFGYNPVFIPDGYTQTFAELGDDVKNSISHRQKAFLKLAQWLKHSRG
jgi:XTP/dITP diphosphohydrolase